MAIRSPSPNPTLLVVRMTIYTKLFTPSPRHLNLDPLRDIEWISHGQRQRTARHTRLFDFSRDAVRPKVVLRIVPEIRNRVILSNDDDVVGFIILDLGQPILFDAWILVGVI